MSIQSPKFKEITQAKVSIPELPCVLIPPPSKYPYVRPGRVCTVQLLKGFTCLVCRDWAGFSFDKLTKNDIVITAPYLSYYLSWSHVISRLTRFQGFRNLSLYLILVYGIITNLASGLMWHCLKGICSENYVRYIRCLKGKARLWKSDYCFWLKEFRDQ